VEVYLSPLAEKKLDLLIRYLESRWGNASKIKFLGILKKEIELLSSHPYRCKRAKRFSDLYICIITKQTSAIYQIKKEVEEIEIVTFFDNRQDPEKIQEEIKNHFD
jgi:plasmid stabilization system protein ParE